LKLAFERCSGVRPARKALAASVMARPAALGALLSAAGAISNPTSTAGANVVMRAMAILLNAGRYHRLSEGGNRIAPAVSRARTALEPA